MNLKLLLFTFITTIFLSSAAKAQVSVGDNPVGYYAFSKLKQKDFEAFKSRTTLFVVDQFELDEFESILKDTWTITPYEIVSSLFFHENPKKYYDEKYSIWKLGGHVMSTKSSDYLFVYIEYFYPTKIKFKKKRVDCKKNEIAAIYFGGNTGSMWEMVGSLEFKNLEEDLYNYRLGYMKNYIQYINNMLAAGESSSMHDDEYNEEKIKELATHTLYVPDYNKTKSNWGYSDSERENPDELFKDYPFKYEFIGNDELNTKILDGKEELYYLMYTKINGQKLITVINGKTGDIIYKDRQSMSYQLKSKDLKELGKIIKKSLK